MTITRNELLTLAAQDFAYQHYQQVIFMRDNSASYAHAQGYLKGLCTAYRVEYEILKESSKQEPSKQEITMFRFSHQGSGRKFLEVKID